MTPAAVPETSKPLAALKSKVLFELFVLALSLFRMVLTVVLPTVNLYSVLAISLVAVAI